MSYDHWKTTDPDAEFLGDKAQGGETPEERAFWLDVRLDSWALPCPGCRDLVQWDPDKGGVICPECGYLLEHEKG
jgi:hypothetical protein